MIIVWLLNILLWAVGLYTLIVWIRFFIEFALSLAPRWQVPPALRMVFEIVFTLTDPPVRLFRKLVPPLRMGPIMLDFGILLTLVACNVASWLVARVVAGMVYGGV